MFPEINNKAVGRILASKRLIRAKSVNDLIGVIEENFIGSSKLFSSLRKRFIFFAERIHHENI